MAIPFPVCQDTAPGLLFPVLRPWGRALHSTRLHSVLPDGCGTCWSVALFHFGLSFILKNDLSWEEQSNKNLGCNWDKQLWQKMGMGANRFPAERCNVYHSDLTVDLHWCEVKNDPPPSFTYFYFWIVHPFNCQERISLPHCSKWKEEQGSHFCVKD